MNCTMATEHVTEWITAASVEKTREEACHRLWRLYVNDVKRVAVRRTHGLGRAVEDDEDVAVRAFATIFRELANGSLPHLRCRTDFWKLLCTITRREATRTIERHLAQRRDIHRQVSWDDGRHAPYPRQRQTPDESASLVGDILQVIDQPGLRRIVELKQCGYSNLAIARRMRLSERTIERRLVTIRRLVVRAGY